MTHRKLKVSMDREFYFFSSPFVSKKKKIKNQFQLLIAILISLTLAVPASVSGTQHRAVCYS